ncbi:MAG: outer membrane beta-barrel protein [Pseudomonadota bacterium]
MSLAFLALPATLGLMAVPVWSQSGAPVDDDPFPDAAIDAGGSGAPGQNGLRGRFDPDSADTTLRSGRGTSSATDRFLRGTTAPESGSRRDTTDTRADEPRDGANIDAVREATVQDVAPPTAPPRDVGDEVDPFAPLGIRLGSFLLFPELGAERVYDDNVFLSATNPQGDWRYELTPSLEIQSDWSRHSLIGTVSAVRSYYDNLSGENDKDFAAELTGRLDIRSTTNLVGSVSYAEEPEDRSSSDFPLDAADRALTRTKAASLEGNHTLNRVTLTLRGELESEDFDDATANDGSTINNDDRDYTERRITGRAAYEFQPGVAAFVEASANERDFVETTDDNGLLNGSSGYDVQAGLSFLLSGKLTGEASIGYAVQTPEETSQVDVSGVIFNAGLEWQATGLTTFRLDASSEVDETTDAGSAGSLIRSVELSVEHRPRRNILVGASVEYENEKFAGTNDEEEEWLFGVNGEYIFTPSVALTVAYQHANNTSNVPGNGYTANEVRFGVRVRR